MLSEGNRVEERGLYGPKRSRDIPGAGGAAGPPLGPSVSQVELAGPAKGPCTKKRKVVATPGS